MTLLFAGIALLYLILIFWTRNRISARRDTMLARKTELAPMISNFLFFDPDGDPDMRESYIRMKLEIRELLRTKINRDVLTEILTDLRMDVSGEARERLFKLYQDLGLHRDAYRRLQSWRWERISLGILQLAEMQVTEAYPFIRKFINHKRGVIRKQAQLAVVALRDEGMAYFLDTVTYGISEWQQLKLVEILSHRKDYVPPNFSTWLVSDNRDVVLLALRLVRLYRQGDAEKSILRLLGHRNQAIQIAAIDCIREFMFPSARIPLRELFGRASQAVKLEILEALSLIGTAEDLDFLEKKAAADSNFNVRSKSRGVINTLCPDTVLPYVEGEVANVPGDQEPELPKKTDTRNENMPLPRSAGRNPASHPGSEPRSAVTDGGADRFEEVFLEAPAPWEREEEGAHLFDFCFWQELEAILSEQAAATRQPILELDFLPIVTGGFTPADHSGTASWLMAIEVSAESVPSGDKEPEGPAGGPAEGIPAAIDFIPIVLDGTLEEMPVRSGEPDYSAHARQDIGMPEEPGVELTPMFELVAEPTASFGPLDYFAASPETGTDLHGQFSIFREFFNHCDTESKLILLETLPEVGEEKELVFLQTLFEGEDPRVSALAGKVHNELKTRLEGEQVSRNHGGQETGNAPVDQVAPGRYGSHFIDFSPDFTGIPYPGGHPNISAEQEEPIGSEHIPNSHIPEGDE